MEARDLDAADRVMRLAFGTEFRRPDPGSYMGDADLLRPRWRTGGTACLVAEVGGAVVGSVVMSFWGRLAVLGPLTVHPDHWNGGIARGLMAAALEAADRASAVTALYTFPASPRHLRLYESLGFASGHLVAIMMRNADPATAGPPPELLAPSAPGLDACAGLAGQCFPGLDLTVPIRAALAQGLGDVVLVRRAGVLAGFALCHTGAGSEAGSGVVKVKFAAAEPGAFLELLGAVEAYAAFRGAATVQVAVNVGRRAAYASLKDRGYRTEISGVAMLRPDVAGYADSRAHVLEEWR